MSFISLLVVTLLYSFCKATKPLKHFPFPSMSLMPCISYKKLHGVGLEDLWSGPWAQRQKGGSLGGEGQRNKQWLGKATELGLRRGLYFNS